MAATTPDWVVEPYRLTLPGRMCLGLSVDSDGSIGMDCPTGECSVVWRADGGFVEELLLMADDAPVGLLYTPAEGRAEMTRTYQGLVRIASDIGRMDDQSAEDAVGRAERLMVTRHGDGLLLMARPRSRMTITHVTVDGREVCTRLSFGELDA